MKPFFIKQSVWRWKKNRGFAFINCHCSTYVNRESKNMTNSHSNYLSSWRINTSSTIQSLLQWMKVNNRSRKREEQLHCVSLWLALNRKILMSGLLGLKLRKTEIHQGIWICFSVVYVCYIPFSFLNLQIQQDFFLFSFDCITIHEDPSARDSRLDFVF